MKTYELNVKGRVQGVWYRKYTIKYANELNIVGHVQNLEDGSVQVIANIDTKEKLENFIERLYKGSPFSKVSEVTCKQIEEKDFKEFQQK